MKSISTVLWLFVFSSPSIAQTTVHLSSDSTTEQELIRIAQELYDAVAVGDKAVWEKYVADDIIYTDENWRILTKMVASHIIVRPSERQPLAVDPKHFAAIVGEYELTSGIAYTITIEDNKLMGQRSGREKEELLPADENTFFPKGTVRGEKVFVRDASGRVTHMLDRRENNDLVWMRVK